jgi:hypothetical protein
MSYANSRKSTAVVPVTTPNVKTWVSPDVFNVGTVPATITLCDATGLTAGFLYQFQVGLLYSNLPVNESYVSVRDSLGAEIRQQACFSNAGIQTVTFDQQILIPFICPEGETEVSVSWINTAGNSSGQLRGDNIRIVELGQIIV